MENRSATPDNHRALAAIVLTDAVGFSARMSIDEGGTLRLIQRDLKMMESLCEQYQGQVLKSTGDGLLMAFSSAVQAVSCSQAIQVQLAELAEGCDPGDYLQHRIGIHLGDVLFSHSDVLGNGVNIAARLQTQSVPNGICMSQTVYDVVKARLDLKAVFLGPLRLKNIHEPVPAYQIPPLGEETIATTPQEPLTQWGTADPLTTAITQLEQDPNHWRIKKLIFGTSQNVWENDPTVLSRFDLRELLQTLTQRYGGLDALQTAFNGIIARLNRQGEYLAVASRILAVVQPIYDQQSQARGAEETAITAGESGYQRVAQQLNASPQAARLKKLLHAITTDTWESNVAVLDQHGLDFLVATAHQMAPTLKELRYHLERIIRRLNHQDRYTRIAQILVDAFQPLYRTDEEGTYLAMDEEGTTLRDATALAAAETEPSQGDTLVTATRITSGESPLADGTIAYPEPRSTPASSPASALNQGCDRTNLFALRLEIMRYTSPLRAKILLLSTIRSPFTFSHQDWLTLKEKTLDDLIQDIFHYCPTFHDLESKLTIISHCLDNAHENTQAAGAILQAMKPYYDATSSLSAPSGQG
ncbi:MAG: adenylate/guanylate cyclase domain-containing protein [Leptolyngbya sp.]|nr:adenylate/guanylate cyclase domain-containing protein [Leptolyngbya sp.]